MKKLIGCGCSWTYGSWIPLTKAGNLASGKKKTVKNYITFLSELLNYDYNNISKSGVSNYCIIKQIEYAVKNKPNLIVFNTTSSGRIDFVKTTANLNTIPRLENFDFPIENATNEIVSFTHMGVINKAYLSLNYIPSLIDDFESVREYLMKFSNLYLSEDQDRLMFNGLIKKLDDNNIPYIGVDFWNIIEGNNDRILKKDIMQIAKTYPLPDDPYHFNEEGHHVLAKELVDLIKVRFL